MSLLPWWLVFKGFDHENSTFPFLSELLLGFLWKTFYPPGVKLLESCCWDNFRAKMCFGCNESDSIGRSSWVVKTYVSGTQRQRKRGFEKISDEFRPVTANLVVVVKLTSGFEIQQLY